MTSNWCRFGIHRWTKYREPERVRDGIYIRTIQERRCDSCNRTDFRTVGHVIG